MHRILQFLRREDGPTAVEYAVMLALILVVCLAAISLVGTQTRGVWVDSSTKIDSAISGS